MKILVVEDDANLAQMLSQVLGSNHYQVELAADGVAGLSLVEAFDYDLILLDLHLPKLDGIHFCQRARAAGEDVPILLMTAEDATASKIAGLDAGADDYVIKPLVMDELLARIRALLRRGRTETSPVLGWGGVNLDPSNGEVFCFGERLHLTNKEYELLELLLRNPHRIFSLDVLLERLWAYEKIPSDNAVRTHVKSLRRKLKQCGIVDMVETVYGLGYRLGPEPDLEMPSAPLCAEDADGQPSLMSVDGQKSSAAALQASTVDQLYEIWEKHQQRYLDLITRLEDVLPVLGVPQAERGAALLMHRDEIVRSQQVAHTLKGALGSFGFMRSSKIAGDIERLLFAAPQQEGEKIDQLPMLIQSLRQSLQQKDDGVMTATGLACSCSASGMGTTVAPHTSESSHATALKSAVLKGKMLPSDYFNGSLPAADALFLEQLSQQTNPGIYQWLIVECDQALLESLLRQASTWSISTRIATTLEEARQALLQHTPGVVMVDPSCADTLEEGLGFLRELAVQQPSLPIIVATDLNALSNSPEGRLRHRAEVIRVSQNSIFLQKPTAVEHMLEIVNRCLMERSQAGAKVLVLDDDPQILQCLNQLLAPWGFQLTLLSDPFQFWDALEQTMPDLLILDIEMPDFNGLDLCQVIRHDPNFHQLPILFLSAHAEAEVVQRVFECGADDYVSKPIVGPELVARILNRLERRQMLRRLAETDSLTGLSCRRQSVELLARLTRLANRQQTKICFVLLDLDQFKQVNDRYGHDMGDRVLKTFGIVLKQTFRGEDVVARWGGEEFVVGLYDTSKEQAVERMTLFLEQFVQNVFESAEGAVKQTFRISFSGGVAAYPDDGKTIQLLYQRADEALYLAKAAGRSRVLPASTIRESEPGATP